MVSETQIDNDASDSSSIDSQLSQQGLTGPYLNADDLLRQSLPRLVRGIPGVETTIYAPRIIHHYGGPIAKWNYFNESVMDFYKDARTRAELDRCANVPIYMDKAIEQVNGEAMTRETIQCGAEITLSGRYFSNALAVVASIVQTLGLPAHGQSANPNLLPRELAFGDSKILDSSHRVNGMEPDIILKLPIQGKDQIRLVGELKFFPTVDLEHMIQNFHDGDTREFCAILGQLVNYMLGHNLKYGFTSNYEHTVFVQLDQRDGGNGGPCTYFSDIIQYNDIIDDSNGKISVRLALFYLIYKTCSPDAAAWRIPDHLDAMELKDKWIVLKSVNENKISTPFGKRDLLSPEPGVEDLTGRVAYLDLQTPRKRSTSFSSIFSSPPSFDSTPYRPPAGSKQPGRSNRMLRSHQDRSESTGG